MSNYNEEYLDVAQLLSENSNDSNGISALMDSDTHDSSSMPAVASNIDHDYEDEADEEYEYRSSSSRRRGNKRSTRVTADIRRSFKIEDRFLWHFGLLNFRYAMLLYKMRESFRYSLWYVYLFLL